MKKEKEQRVILAGIVLSTFACILGVFFIFCIFVHEVLNPVVLLVCMGVAIFLVLAAMAKIMTGFLERHMKMERRMMEIKNSREGRFRTIIEKADGIIFEWDYDSDNVYLSDSWTKKFYYPSIQDDFINNLLRSEVMHPDDVLNFIKRLEEIKQGRIYAEEVVRMKRWPKDYCWNKVFMMVIHNDTGKCDSIVGIILDIDDERSKVEVLQEKAEKDSLTKLYNKGTTEIKVVQKLRNMSEGSMGAFFIIDIDNFKGFNDKYGHIYGDTVLRDVTLQLKSVFRVNDIIGRIGGDEFVVFLDNMNSLEEVINKAESITMTFRKSCSNEDEKCRISGSVGVSIYPKDGSSYNELYQNADNALYMAKNNGKNQYFLYSNDNKK